MDDLHPVLALTGATATGKTGLGIEIARRIGGEIISADSRQVYRGLDIGTAKPRREERASVPHHCIDICDASESYSAGRFFDDAIRLVREIAARGNTPLVVGGTGLYIQVLMDGIFDAPPPDAAIRDGLRAAAGRGELPKLFERLRALDPEGAETIDRQNPARVIRALEICLQTGEQYSRVRRERLRRAPFALKPVVLQRGREDLYRRINARADAMFAEGLVGEVRRLVDSGVDPGWTSMQAVGYKEAWAYISSRCSEEEMREDIRRNTRRFAKRQVTWFRRMVAAQRLEAAPDLDAGKLAEQLLEASRIHE